MDLSRCHRLVHVIYNMRGPGQYNTNSNIFFLCFDLSLFKGTGYPSNYVKKII